MIIVMSVEALDCTGWNLPFINEIQMKAIKLLEEGNIIFCPKLSFQLLPHEEKFLSSHYAHKKVKNISFNMVNHSLSGVTCQSQEFEELRSMIKRFAMSAHQLIKQLYPSYEPFLKIGRTSFRPVEIAGRRTSYRKDDTRLHVDAFPSSPNQGWRILRVFTNINPNGYNREWRVGEPFHDIVQRFLPKVRPALRGSSEFLKWVKITKSYRTTYDHIMLQIHNQMKADMKYQQSSPQTGVSFAPGASWIVQTDHVSHAAMSGQHALEQTFYLPVTAMKNPELSPLRILEKLTGKTLVAKI